MSSQPKYRYRSAVTGKYVTQIYALGNERETYRVIAKPRGPNRPKVAPKPQAQSTESPNGEPAEV